MPSHKRKTLESDSSDDSSDIEAYSPPLKRRRCDALESGFAQLTLDPALQAAQAADASLNLYAPTSAFQNSLGGDGFLPGASLSTPSYSGWNTATPVRNPPPEYSDVIHPGSVEEPTPPAVASEVPEVAMKSRSWYEPEKDRIVIVDLDDDSDVEDSTGGPSSMHVNSVLLDRLRSRHEPDFQAYIPSIDSGKALVLFKPLPFPSTLSSDIECKHAEDTYNTLPMRGVVEDVDDFSTQHVSLIDDDDDAMDIEQI